MFYLGIKDLLREQNRQGKAELSTITPELIHQSIADSIVFLTAQLKRLQSQINDHIDRHPELKNNLDLLQSIPPTGPQSSTQLLYNYSDSAASLTQAPIDTAGSNVSSADNPPCTCMAYEEISHYISGCALA